MIGGPLGSAVGGGVLRTRDIPARGISHAVVTVQFGGVAVQAPLAARTRTITVQAALTNPGVVYLGDKNVTNAAGDKVGYALDKGESLQEIPVERSSDLYVAADEVLPVGDALELSPDQVKNKLVIFGVQ